MMTCKMLKKMGSRTATYWSEIDHTHRIVAINVRSTQVQTNIGVRQITAFIKARRFSQTVISK